MENKDGAQVKLSTDAGTYDRLKIGREDFLNRARENARFTIPALMNLFPNRVLSSLILYWQMKLTVRQRKYNLPCWNQWKSVRSHSGIRPINSMICIWCLQHKIQLSKKVHIRYRKLS